MIALDEQLTTVEGWNRFAGGINSLMRMRGENGVQVHLAPSGMVIEGTAITSQGLTELDDEISSFIHVGTGEFWLPELSSQDLYVGQPIRVWNQPGEVYNYVNEVGEWEVWRPNGRNDFTWRLQLKLSRDFYVDRLELYQVVQQNGGVPFWNSGQAWSTDNPVTPFAHQPGSNPFVDPTGEFQVFPLKVYAGGSPYGSGVAVNTDYAAQLSETLYEAEETHTFYLHGDSAQPIPPTQFFRVICFLRRADTGGALREILGTIGAAPTDPETEI